MFGEHRSWCYRLSPRNPQPEMGGCTCDFENRWADPVEKAKFAVGHKVCALRGHGKTGSYGSNDSWCLRCGVLIAGPSRAGEVGYLVP